ncbi:MAG: hypothetical protein ACLGHP_02110 [Vicinamibacteria bacterium]
MNPLPVEPHDDRSEVGRDLLDAQVATTPVRPRLVDVLGRTRAALGLRPLTAPALLFVPIGAALGPAGADWLGVDLLGRLYPVMAAALAALGIFVGLGLNLEEREERRLLAAASLEALVTIVMVSAALAWLLTSWGARPDIGLWPLTLALGLCASATAAGMAPAGSPEGDRLAVRVADLDDVLPIVMGGVVLAMTATSAPFDIARLAVGNVALGLAVALAGWLLFDRAHGEAERAVFVIGVVALLGGGAAYLGVSPLLSGMVAGLFWKYAPGRADTIIRDDLRRLQHPLVVLLLIFAGASAQPGVLALWLVGPYVLVRLAGKLLGGWLVSRWLFGLPPGDVGGHLLAPGVIGLAFALSFHHASGSAASLAVLTAVAAGTLLGEIVAAFALVGPGRR